METFTKVKVDFWKFNRSLISKDSSKSLESRGPLRLLKVFEHYDFSSKQLRHIKLVTAARGRGTQNSHNRILSILEKFCLKAKFTKKCDLLSLKEDSLLDYFLFLEDNSVKLAQLKGLKGAILFLVSAVRIPDPWSLEVDRAYEALIRRASCERNPVKKAPLLPLWVLPRAIDSFVTPFLDNPDKVDFILSLTKIFFLFYDIFGIIKPLLNLI